jgi:hypothetical protein
MVFPVTCEVCGFRWNELGPHEVPSRLVHAVESFTTLILDADAKVGLRPSAQRWSILEYGGHLRDVLISIRERIITACIVDDWTGPSIHREERIELGFYSPDLPAEVISELLVTSRLLVKTFEAVRADQLGREFIFSTVSPSRVTILWAGAQAVHESEHHLADVRENLALL